VGAHARVRGATSTARRFVLLDRDGTINEEVDHLDHPDDLLLIHGSAAAIRRLREQGLGVVVVTNQAQIGRGLLSEERLTSIHDRLIALLAAEGAEVDAILHCPHAPELGCECRKPGTGMALEAAARFGFDPARSFVVGDHAGDVGMGRALGATTFLVLTGHGAEERARAEGSADHVVPDLAAAAAIIASLVDQEAE
jgi:D-glycero-D-manno-heptose 1,7-bisphosphate phosphatase